VKSPNHLFVTNFSSVSDEWWTPTDLIELCRCVLGGIDLDPASSTAANKRIGASYIYSREDNGLEQPWFGRVYLNPPSRNGDPTARPHLWARKLEDEYLHGNVDAACLLVKSVLGYKWYEHLYANYWCCHLRERPAFVRPDGTTVGQAKKGVTVFLFAGNSERIKLFFDTFVGQGKVVAPGYTVTREIVNAVCKSGARRRLTMKEGWTYRTPWAIS